MRILVGIALAAVLATSARAECDVKVLDEVGALSGNISQVLDATNRLGNAASADVRVRVFNGLHGAASLDALKDQLVASCPTWRAGNGTIRSSMIMLFYAPGQKPDIGFYYGVSSQPKLSGNWQGVLRDKFVPAVTAYKNGEKTALGPGFVATLSDLSALFLRPAAAAGPTTIINNAASDHSALWSFLKWVLILGGFGAVIYGGYSILTISQTRSRNSRSAQTDARRVRSEVVSGILEISDETLDAVLQANVEAAAGQSISVGVHAARQLSAFRSHVKGATSSFSSFDRLDGADPNADGLSVDTYRRNERRYSEILSRHIIPARDLANEIKRGIFNEPPVEPTPAPKRQPPPKPKAPDYTPRRPSRSTDFRSSPYRAPAPASPSVVIVETPSPVVIERESSWSRSDSYRSSSRDEPSYRSSRDDDSGGSFTSSSSSDSGGSFSSSSSSDSGGSLDSGSSSSDSGGSSSSSD